MSDVLIKVDSVSKRFCRSLKRSLLYGLQDLSSEISGQRYRYGVGLPQSSADLNLRKDEFWAVKDVSFELRRGDCLGLIGRNGAGKTTLLRILNGLIKPDTGRIDIKGKVGALIALGAGFNPVLSGRENIYVSGAIFGLSRKDIDDRIGSIVEFAGIPEFIDSPVQTYSSGMAVRLGFAIATAIQPDILLVDEVLAVGDIEFRIKCYNKLAELRATTATILVSHSMPDIGRTSTSCVLMRKGSIALHGDPAGCIAEYNTIEPSGLNGSKQIKSNACLPILSKPIQDCRIKSLKWYNCRGGCFSCSFAMELFSGIRIDKIRLRILIDDPIGGKLYEWSSSDYLMELSLKLGINNLSIEIGDIYFSTGSYVARVIIEDQLSGDYLVNYEPAFAFQISKGSVFGAKCRGKPSDVIIREC